jgi:hypothetical protein
MTDLFSIIGEEPYAIARVDWQENTNERCFGPKPVWLYGKKAPLSAITLVDYPTGRNLGS